LGDPEVVVNVTTPDRDEEAVFALAERTTSPVPAPEDGDTVSQGTFEDAVQAAVAVTVIDAVVGMEEGTHH